MLNKLITELNFSIRQPSVLYSASLLLVSLLVGIFMFYFWYPSYSELNSKQIELKGIKDAYFEKQSAFELSEQYSNASKKIKKIENKLTLKTSQSDIIKNISQLLLNNNLKVKKEIFKEVNERDIVFLKQELSLIGDYEKIKRFIFDINNSPYLSHVKNSIFERNKNTNMINAKLIIISFMREK